MPAKALWLLHIPEIIAMLETFDVPVVDRAIIERLFGLRTGEGADQGRQNGDDEPDRHHVDQHGQHDEGHRRTRARADEALHHSIR